MSLSLHSTPPDLLAVPDFTIISRRAPNNFGKRAARVPLLFIHVTFASTAPIGISFDSRSSAAIRFGFLDTGPEKVRRYVCTLTWKNDDARPLFHRFRTL